MVTKVIERKQRFREQYPDPEVRHRMHYGFAHEFLPRYVHRDPWAFFVSLHNYSQLGGLAGPVHFIQSRWRMMEVMSGMAELDLDICQELHPSGLSDRLS